MLTHRIDLPAGGRPMSKEDPRPEYAARQEFFQLPEAIEAEKKHGIDFGLMLMAPDKLPADFDPAALGVPYGIHIANETLTQLYAAYLSGDEETMRKIHLIFERFASWKPAPDYSTLHMGGTGRIPDRLDDNRMNVVQSSSEILTHLKWLRRTYARILDILPSASPENVAKDQFVGPPRWDFGGEWLGMTYQEDRRGVGPDIAYITAGTPGEGTFDFEHWSFSSGGLHGTSLEYQGLSMPKVSELDKAGQEIYHDTGLLYVRGKPVGVPVSITTCDIIRQLRPKFLHVGGIHPVVVEISDEEAKNRYHEHLQEILPPDVWQLVSRRRVGSHAIITENDEMLKAGVIDALKCGAKISVLEVASYGEGSPKDGSSPGCWYWQPKDALEQSFRAYCRMLPDLIQAARAQ